MRLQYLASTAALTITIALSTQSATIDSRGRPDLSTPSSLTLALSNQGSDIRAEEAARFAKQATFGPTVGMIDEIVAGKSIDSWIANQFTLSDSSYKGLIEKSVPDDLCSRLEGTERAICFRDNFSATPVQMRFYTNAVTGKDQLRQRTAFALSQIIVASEYEVHNTTGIANFQQILLQNAFGNYRDILKSVTLNPFMGDYLDIADSTKTHPSENYARELLQLFTTGTTLLHSDGTPQTDDAGAPIPAYSNADVKEISRALTGWVWARVNGASVYDYNNRDWSHPMVPYALRFDTGSKNFLSTTIPAGATQEQNIDAVLDAAFNHPNTAPFVSKRLIQQLTIANPTPAYVGRVSAVFANNGSGIRGDMKSVIIAILTDPEARTTSQVPGKIKEPVLLATSLARAIGFQTDGYAFTTRDLGMGQAVFRAPSVFNYYAYETPLPQGSGLLSPVSKIMTTSTMVARHNLIYDWTVDGDQSRIEYQKQATISYSIGSKPEWASWEAYGADDGKIVDRINLVLLNGTMTKAQRQSVLTAMAQIKNSDAALQTRKRAQVALYIAASSPLFQVDR